MIYPVEKKVDLRGLEGLAELKSKVKEKRLVEKLGEQGFHFDTIEHYEPTTRRVNRTDEKLVNQSKATTAAFENKFNNFRGTCFALADTQKSFEKQSVLPEKQEKNSKKEPNINFMLSSITKFDNKRNLCWNQNLDREI